MNNPVKVLEEKGARLEPNTEYRDEGDGEGKEMEREKQKF